MGLYIPPIFKGAVIFLLGSVLIYLATKLWARVTEQAAPANRTFLRALVSLAIFVALYYGADLVIDWSSYDVYQQTLQYLAAVIGAGCYWIGSQK